MNNRVAIWTRSSWPTDYFGGNKWSSTSFTLEGNNSTYQRNSWQISQMYKTVDAIFVFGFRTHLVVARQLALAWFRIFWIMQRKMNPYTELQDITYMRKRSQENKERNARKEWRKSGGLQWPMLVLAERRSKALTSVAPVVGHTPAKRKVASWIPGQGTCLGCGFGPWLGAYEKQINRCSSLTLMYFF